MQCFLLSNQQMDLVEEAVQFFKHDLTKYLLDPTKSDTSKVCIRSKLEMLKPIVESLAFLVIQNSSVQINMNDILLCDSSFLCFLESFCCIRYRPAISPNVSEFRLFLQS